MRTISVLHPVAKMTSSVPAPGFHSLFTGVPYWTRAHVGAPLRASVGVDSLIPFNVGIHHTLYPKTPFDVLFA